MGLVAQTFLLGNLVLELKRAVVSFNSNSVVMTSLLDQANPATPSTCPIKSGARPKLSHAPYLLMIHAILVIDVNILHY